MGWHRLKLITDVPFLAVGTLLTVYIGVAAFGYVKNSSEYYSNFILGVCLMSGLLAVRYHCHEKIDGPLKPLFWPRFAFSVLALVTSAIAMGYVRLHAVELEQTQPFFNDTDMVFGWLMTVSILALCMIHWGMLLTAVIALSIVYFFFGYLIPNPLLVTPHYDAKFIMNYIGLGTNQGFYFLTQIAADFDLFPHHLRGDAVCRRHAQYGAGSRQGDGPAHFRRRRRAGDHRIGHCRGHHGAGGLQRGADRPADHPDDEKARL